MSCFYLAACIFPSQSGLASPIKKHPAPRLFGVNHLFTIKGPFSQPAGIAIDPDGRIYVADSGKSAVYVLDSEGKLLETIGRFGWREGEFDKPEDVAVDAQLRLYIADSGNKRIQKYSLINRDFSVIAGEKQDGFESVSIEPQSIATDTGGYIYIVDAWNSRILKIDPLGRILMELGGAGQLKNPRGIMIDNYDNIYISDENALRKFDFSGSQVTAWNNTRFQNPMGISQDKFGNVYIVDQGSHKVLIFSSDGIYLTEFGEEYLENPVDVAISSGGYAYVTDASVGDIEVYKIIISD